MKVIKTPLAGVVVIEPKVFRDDRGYFLETYNQEKLSDQEFTPIFVQDNHSLSQRGTVRGLHAQRLQPQGKLVRAVEGTIFDVAIDLRQDSPTYRHWWGTKLSEENFLQLYIPPGFAHGFSVLSERAQVQYKCTALYNASDEISLRWDEAKLINAETGEQTGVDWQLGLTEPVLSQRDAEAPLLEEIEPKLLNVPAYCTSGA